MEIVSTIVSVLLGIAALFFSVISLAISLSGREVAATLGVIEAQEMPDTKRRIARCLLHLVAVGSVLSVTSVPVAFWLSKHWGTAMPSPPAWFIIPAVCGIIFLQLFGQVLILLCRLAYLLREPNVLSLGETVSVFWSMFQRPNSFDKEQSRE